MGEERDELLAWLCRWGSFKNYDEMTTHGWSLTDVLTIMQEYQHSPKPEQVEAATFDQDDLQKLLDATNAMNDCEAHPISNEYQTRLTTLMNASWSLFPIDSNGTPRVTFTGEAESLDGLENEAEIIGLLRGREVDAYFTGKRMAHAILKDKWKPAEHASPHATSQADSKSVASSLEPEQVEVISVASYITGLGDYYDEHPDEEKHDKMRLTDFVNWLQKRKSETPKPAEELKLRYDGTTASITREQAREASLRQLNASLSPKPAETGAVTILKKRYGVTEERLDDARRELAEDESKPKQESGDAVVVELSKIWKRWSDHLDQPMSQLTADFRFVYDWVEALVGRETEIAALRQENERLREALGTLRDECDSEWVKIFVINVLNEALKPEQESGEKLRHLCPSHDGITEREYQSLTMCFQCAIDDYMRLKEQVRVAMDQRNMLAIKAWPEDRERAYELGNLDQALAALGGEG